MAQTEIVKNKQKKNSHRAKVVKAEYRITCSWVINRDVDYCVNCPLVINRTVHLRISYPWVINRAVVG